MSAALTRQQLYDRVWAAPMTQVAAELGLSGGGLAKICDRLLIPYPPRGHWARAKAGRASEPPPLPGQGAAPALTAGERSRTRRRQTRAPAEVRRSADPLVHQFVNAEPEGPVHFHYPGPSVAQDFGAGEETK